MRWSAGNSREANKVANELEQRLKDLEARVQRLEVCAAVEGAAGDACAVPMAVAAVGGC